MPTRKLQNPDDFRGQKFYVGIDVHKKSWAVTVRSLSFVVDHFTQPPSTEALLSHLQRKFTGEEFYSAYEAGFSGTGIHEQLCKLGIKNIVVHPGDISGAYYCHRIKFFCDTKRHQRWFLYLYDKIQQKQRRRYGKSKYLL